MGERTDMLSAAYPPKLTYQDFLRFPDDGRRHELIDGAHYVSPSPATRHQRLSWRLSQALGRYLDAHPVGEAFHAPYDVVLSMFDVVEPDLLVVLREQSDLITDQHVRGAPALVVEILSATTRQTDEGAKLRLYERSGVREYWLVDPECDQVEIHRRSTTGSFQRRAVLMGARQEVLRSSLLPEFALPLEEFFR